MPFSKPGRKKSDAMLFIMGHAYAPTDECILFTYPQKQLSFGGSTRSPHWVSCFLVNGAPPEGTVPVRKCGVRDCINGTHFKWGTLDEAQSARVFSSRAGAGNPNAKLNDEQVRDIKSRVYKNGRDKMLTAKEFGITPKTLGLILKGVNWSWVKTDKGDEF